MGARSSQAPWPSTPPTLKSKGSGKPTAVFNRHAAEVQFNIPTPKDMPMKRTSEGLAEYMLADAERLAGRARAGGETEFLTRPEAKRNNEPPIYNKKRGDKATALDVCGDASKREAAMANFEADRASGGDTSHFNYLTWKQLHIAWWSFDGKDPMCSRLPRRRSMPWGQS